MKEAPSSAPVAFPWDKHHARYAAKSFMHIYAYLVTQNIKKVSAKRFWFDEINSIFCIIKDSLQCKWLFFFFFVLFSASVWWWKIYRITLNTNTAQKASWVLVLFGNNLWPHIERISVSLRGWWNELCESLSFLVMKLDDVVGLSWDDWWAHLELASPCTWVSLQLGSFRAAGILNADLAKVTASKGALNGLLWLSFCHDTVQFPSHSIV